MSSAATDLDVVDATAEALPLELLNKTNKELTAQLSHYEQLLDANSRSNEEQRKRLQFMKEHLGNVRAEIVNTQSLCESKQREIESEENMHRIIERECGRLQQRRGQLRRSEDEAREQTTALQDRILRTQLQLDEIKAAMDFNQEELEQWDAARRQKEEDELAIAQYTKQDEAKIRQLRLRVEKLERTVRERRQQLDDELLATQKAQIELDVCAADYRRLHRERGGLLDEWEAVVRTIAERDDAIRVAATQYAEGVEWLRQRHAVRKELSEQHEHAQAETATLNATIAQHEKEVQQYRDAVPVLQREVDNLDDELEATRENLRRAVRERRGLSDRLRDAGALLEQKSVELEQARRRREDAVARLQREMAAAQDLQQQAGLVVRLLAEATTTERNLDGDVARLKEAQFRANQTLHELRSAQSLHMADITGAQAQGKNLHAKINQLDAESFSQQGILYNIEFSVQQMEKKVSRVKGERTEEEKKELHAKIALLQSTLDELEQQRRTLDTQAKRVREELRRSQVAIDKLQASKTQAEELVLKIELECGHSELEAKQLERRREDGIIKADTMELQLNRLRRRLRQHSHALLDLEERRQQLTADIAEREAEIAVHQGLLRMEAKFAEEERRRLVSELGDRQRSLAATRNRHDTLVGRMDPAKARLSQAQLVIEAAKEREALQQRGDNLDSRIRRMEKEMLKLEKTIAVMRASNTHYKHKFDKATDEDDEVKTQKLLREKFRELKALMSRRVLEANDYQPTLLAKRRELEQLSAERAQLERTLHDLEQEYNQATQEILNARETTLRYEQAIGKARATVDAATQRDIALLESRERLGLTVAGVLRCARRAGEDVLAATRQRLLEAGVPIAEAVA